MHRQDLTARVTTVAEKKRHRFKQMWFKAYPLKSNLRTCIALTSHVLRHKARRKKRQKDRRKTLLLQY